MTAYDPNCRHCAAASDRQIAVIVFICKTAVMSKLILQYKFDASFFDPKLTRDDFGRLSEKVESDHFSGRGGFWVQWQDVKEFGEALGAFPIAEDKPIVAQWGYDAQDGDDLILRLEVSAADKRGNLAVQFEVADDYVPRNRVRGYFLTNYPELDAFRVSIARMMDNQAEEAILTGQ